MGCSASRLGVKSASDTLQVRGFLCRRSQMFQAVGGYAAAGGVVGVGSWEREGAELGGGSF